jgi:hypothetical protein
MVIASAQLLALARRGSVRERAIVGRVEDNCERLRSAADAQRMPFCCRRDRSWCWRRRRWCHIDEWPLLLSHPSTRAQLDAQRVIGAAIAWTNAPLALRSARRQFSGGCCSWRLGKAVKSTSLKSPHRRSPPTLNDGVRPWLARHREPPQSWLGSSGGEAAVLERAPTAANRCRPLRSFQIVECTNAQHPCGERPVSGPDRRSSDRDLRTTAACLCRASHRDGRGVRRPVPRRA